MRKILLLTAMFVTFAISAQTVVWMDDFNDEDISDWTLVDADGDGNNWGDQYVINDTNSNPVTPVSLISRSWQTNPLTPDNLATSPVIDLSNASGTIEVTYITQVASQSWDEEHYTLYVSTGNDVATILASTLTLEETLGDAGNTGTPVSHTFDISSMAGQSAVYLTFRHHNVTDMDFISIDDVTVTAQTVANTNENILANQVSIYPTTVANNFTIKNSSDLALVSATVFDVNGRLIASHNLNNLVGEKTIDVANLTAGMYFVEIQSANNKLVKKIIKK